MDIKIQNELDLLYEMFPDEFKVINELDQCTIVFIITPGIGFNKPVNKFIQFNLKMVLTSKYPIESPVITIECVHGLKEKDILKLSSLLKELILERKGDPILFDLVDFCRDYIANNIPTVECAICLNTFHNESNVYCTTNFHYFHTYCIGEYMNQKQTDYEKELMEMKIKCPYHEFPPLEIPCPLCRTESLPFNEDLVKLSYSRKNCDTSV
ncbi:unnamed protein product [Heterobilharzia americana]|nr:unnamed protein product [Heterobilharzia americana]